MALYADGGYMATKPYAATSTYINRMSDYCSGCRFKPAQKSGPDARPFDYLYWHFIELHAARFAENPRMRMIVNSWLNRSEAEKKAVRDSTERFLAEHVPFATN